jgi:hypothetical protein
MTLRRRCCGRAVSSYRRFRALLQDGHLTCHDLNHPNSVSWHLHRRVAIVDERLHWMGDVIVDVRNDA